MTHVLAYVWLCLYVLVYTYNLQMHISVQHVHLISLEYAQCVNTSVYACAFACRSVCLSVCMYLHSCMPPYSILCFDCHSIVVRPYYVCSMYACLEVPFHTRMEQTMVDDINPALPKHTIIPIV